MNYWSGLAAVIALGMAVTALLTTSLAEGWTFGSTVITLAVLVLGSAVLFAVALGVDRISRSRRARVDR